jgi:hypothetical protein
VTRKKAPASTEDKDGFLKRLGPGLITGASDDDPSGIGRPGRAGMHFRWFVVDQPDPFLSFRH